MSRVDVNLSLIMKNDLLTVRAENNVLLRPMNVAALQNELLVTDAPERQLTIGKASEGSSLIKEGHSDHTLFQ